jgi:hypothetical protein
VNPDPGAFREFAAASVVLDRDAVHRIVNHEAAYAPPGLQSPTTPEPSRERAPALDAPPAGVSPSVIPATAAPAGEESDTTLRIAAAETRELVFEPVGTVPDCPDCGEELPTDRDAVYCPYCGVQLETAPCRNCGESLEPGWRYCLACGTPFRRSRPTDTT